MTTPATVAEFKAQFDRDFIYGTGKETVRDGDIQRALTEATVDFNADLWSTDELKPAFLYAAAHFLVLNVQMAGGLAAAPTGKGVDNHGGGVTQSKAVGQVNINYALADKFQNDPILSQFLRTDYGQRYLQMASTRLVGNIAVVSGWNDTGGPGGGV